MFYNEHTLPHFHAEYQGERGSFDFEGNLLDGEVRSRTAPTSPRRPSTTGRGSARARPRPLSEPPGCQRWSPRSPARSRVRLPATILGMRADPAIQIERFPRTGESDPLFSTCRAGHCPPALLCGYEEGRVRAGHPRTRHPRPSNVDSGEGGVTLPKREGPRPGPARPPGCGRGKDCDLLRRGGARRRRRYEHPRRQCR